jgi:deoxycytidylate deaminase
MIAWSEYYMRLAETSALRSKDPNTKVGCFIANKDNKPVSAGYNGFPAGMEESYLDWSSPNKYNFVVHAEANAIINATQSLKGCTLFSTLYPCRECAKLIAAAQISKVYYRHDELNGKSYFDSVSSDIFHRCDIKIIQLKGD